MNGVKVSGYQKRQEWSKIRQLYLDENKLSHKIIQIFISIGYTKKEEEEKDK